MTRSNNSSIVFAREMALGETVKKRGGEIYARAFSDLYTQMLETVFITRYGFFLL